MIKFSNNTLQVIGGEFRLHVKVTTRPQILRFVPLLWLQQFLETKIPFPFPEASVAMNCYHGPQILQPLICTYFQLTNVVTRKEKYVNPSLGCTKICAQPLAKGLQVSTLRNFQRSDKRHIWRIIVRQVCSIPTLNLCSEDIWKTIEKVFKWFWSFFSSLGFHQVKLHWVSLNNCLREFYQRIKKWETYIPVEDSRYL